MHKCPKCGNEFDTDFCPNCGRKWQEAVTCPKCGAKNSGSSAFCGKCGYQLVETKKTKKHKNDSGWFKKHKKPILITFFSAVALVAVILIIAFIIMPIITNIFKASKVSKIEIGYTQEQVRQILGDPYESQSTNTKWQYFDGEYAKTLKELDENDRKSEQALMDGKFDEIEKLIEKELELTEKLESIVCKYIIVNYQLEKNSDGVNEYVVSSVMLDTQFNNSTEKDVKNYQLRKGEVMLDKSYCNISYSTYFTDGSYYLSSVDAKVDRYDTSTYNTAYVTWSDKYYDSYELKVPVAKGYEINGNELLITADAFNYRSIEDKDSITSVVIKDGVKSISDGAFKGFSNLTSVTIPDSVTSIGKEAFYNCSSLTSVTIPDSVTSIGFSAFAGCSSLESIILPFVGAKAGVTSSNTYQYPFGYIFGTSSYSGGTAVEQYYYASSTSGTTYDTYYIPSSLKSVAVTGGNLLYGAFRNCSSLTSVTIGDSVTSIGEWAFEDCNSLTSVTIPDSVTSIGYGAFYDCYKLIEVKNLSSLTITVGSSSNGYVGYYAKRVYTEGESYLSTDENGYVIYDDGTNKILVAYTGTQTDLTLTSDITQINQYAFYNCSSLTSITIPDSVKSIGNYAFYECSSLTSITIPDSVTSIGDSAFDYCYKLIEVKNLSSLTITAGSSSNGYVGYYAKRVYTEGESYLSTDENGYIIYNDGTDKILVAYIGPETDLSLTNGITQIYKYAFSGCYNLTSVTISNSVTSIGAYAFYGCSNLTSVTIGNSVTSIGNGAFYNCSSLTSVTIGNGVTSIGSSAFRSCTSLTSVTIGNSVTSIGEDAFYDCSKLTSVYITDIAAWCNISFGSYDANPLYYAHNLYLNNQLVTELVIPDSVTSIGSYAFYNCDSLTGVVIPNNVTSIGSYAFYECSSLTSATFENTSGWWYSSSSTATSGTSISATDLANTSTATRYLTSTYYKYYKYYWKRS